MNVSEGIIASRRGCWRVQVGWHLDFESGPAGIGSAGPTIAPITKRPRTGRGFKVTPRPRESCESLSPGRRWPDPSPVRPHSHLPGTRRGLRKRGWLFSTRIYKRVLPGCKSTSLGNQRFPPPLRPLHHLVAYQKPPFVGGVERGLTLSSVLSSHMEFWRPQRSRASIWRAQELRASPSCPHGSCAGSPQTKLVRGLIRTLGGLLRAVLEAP